jgi:hypothetical protein
MSKDFYIRLKDYFNDVGKVLNGKASASSIFLNPTDIGQSREMIYAKVLEQHLPTSCNIRFGGFLFNLEGKESNQIDIMVINDTSPQFNLNNEDGKGKTFACIEGAIAVASLKSDLDSRNLSDALGNIASLPEKENLSDVRLVRPFENMNYEDWPFKMVYAPKGISLENLKAQLQNYYIENPSIPPTKRPNLIHVAGRYYLFKVGPSEKVMQNEKQLPINSYCAVINNVDVEALAYTLLTIKKIAFQSRFIVYHHEEILNQLWKPSS